MQHDLDYDRAWDKVSQQFWRRRWRELVIHFALFVGVQFLMLFEIIGRGTMFFVNDWPLIFLRDMSIDQLPYGTVNWAVILIIHFLALMAIGIGERVFRYSVERELLRDFARVNSIDEKRKMRPSYAALSEDDEAFDMLDEAQEISSRQSTR
jgi:hypothetical protein